MFETARRSRRFRSLTILLATLTFMERLACVEIHSGAAVRTQRKALTLIFGQLPGAGIENNAALYLLILTVYFRRWIPAKKSRCSMASRRTEVLES
jgi:hypothetical protein